MNVHVQGWGGRTNGFGLADCCTNKPIEEFPASATTLDYDFYTDGSNNDVSIPLPIIIIINMFYFSY